MLAENPGRQPRMKMGMAPPQPTVVTTKPKPTAAANIMSGLDELEGL